MNDTLLRLLLIISDGIVAACQSAGPLGAPAGVLFAALSCYGCRLDQFEQVMGALVDAGKVRKVGGCYVALNGGGK